MTVLVDVSDSLASADAGSAAAAMGAVRRAHRVLSRVGAMDAAALVRLRAVGAQSVDLFISTPLGCLVSQRIPGRLENSDAPAVAQLAGVLSALGSVDLGATQLDCGPEYPLLWRGSLPPTEGYALIDTVPASTIRALYTDMGAENRQHGGPLGIARSLLDQKVLKVSSGDGGADSHQPQDEEPPAASGADEVALEGQVIAAMGAVGLVHKPGESMLHYDYARVSATASWIRVDGLFGSVYTPRPGGLARVP